MAIYGWHFLNVDRKLRYGDGRVVKTGRTLSLKKGDPELCKKGMHASRTIYQALWYATSYQRILCRVVVSGDIIEDEEKFVGRHRKVLWSVNANKPLLSFCLDCKKRYESNVHRKESRIRGYLQSGFDHTSSALNYSRIPNYEFMLFDSARRAYSQFRLYAQDYSPAELDWQEKHLLNLVNKYRKRL